MFSGQDRPNVNGGTSTLLPSRQILQSHLRARFLSLLSGTVSFPGGTDLLDGAHDEQKLVGSCLMFMIDDTAFQPFGRSDL